MKKTKRFFAAIASAAMIFSAFGASARGTIYSQQDNNYLRGDVQKSVNDAWRISGSDTLGDFAVYDEDPDNKDNVAVKYTGNNNVISYYTSNKNISGKYSLELKLRLNNTDVTTGDNDQIKIVGTSGSDTVVIQEDSTTQYSRYKISINGVQIAFDGKIKSGRWVTVRCDIDQSAKLLKLYINGNKAGEGNLSHTGNFSAIQYKHINKSKSTQTTYIDDVVISEFVAEYSYEIAEPTISNKNLTAISIRKTNSNADSARLLAVLYNSDGEMQGVSAADIAKDENWSTDTERSIPIALEKASGYGNTLRVFVLSDKLQPCSESYSCWK